MARGRSATNDNKKSKARGRNGNNGADVGFEAQLFLAADKLRKNMFYERDEVSGGEELLERVLERNPRYLPALVRLCESRALATGQDADGIRYCEQALAIDPLLEAARRMLIMSYLDVDDPAAAQQLIDASRGETAVPQTLIALYRRDWLQAGEAAYEALERRTSAPTDLSMVLNAIRMHARMTGDFSRARTAVEAIADVSWDASGRPSLSGGSPYRDGPIALADLLILEGQEERGRRLLAEIIGRMNRERQAGRSERWYWGWHPVALALSGDLEAALAMLERSNAAGSRPNVFRVEADPAFEALYGNPRFEALRRKTRWCPIAPPRSEKGWRVPERRSAEPLKFDAVCVIARARRRLRPERPVSGAHRSGKRLPQHRGQ